MRHAPRMPYCGTCKTMGALYGQRSRMALNHDMVFLAELLMEQADPQEWSRAYRSYNCLTLPRRGESMPLPLEYAATVTVALAHFQIADHVEDSRGLRWKAAARALSPAYLKAAARLRRWKFPLEEMAAVLGTQAAREAKAESLEDVAEPTRIATGLVFSQGARVCGRADLGGSMYELGAKFGSLVYLLDAHEDRERDAKSGAFNAALAFPAVDVRREILTTAAEIAEGLSPVLASRLRANVDRRMGLRVMQQCACHRVSLRERLRGAVALAQTLRQREAAGILKGAAVLATVPLLAFLFPHQARRAESWRECLGLSMNLMALGSVFASSPGPPPGGPPGQVPPSGPPPPMQFRQAVPPSPSGGGGGGCCKGICCDACGEGCGECCCGECCGSCCDACG